MILKYHVDVLLILEQLQELEDTIAFKYSPMHSDFIDERYDSLVIGKLS